MTKEELEKNKIEEEDILEQMEDEIEEVENEDGSINEDRLEESISPEDEICMDRLVKTQADLIILKQEHREIKQI